MRLADRVLGLHDVLEQAAIRYAFGGAIALAYWTQDPRGTSDIDVNAFVPAADSASVLRILPSGVKIPLATEATIARDGQVRLWWDDTPVDLFFDYASVHADAFRHRVFVPFAGSEIPILGPIELTVFKTMFDRTKDWADIEAMIAADAVDLDAVRLLLTSMLGADDDRFRRLDEAQRRGLEAGAA
jgi:hypothetical protein